MKFIKVIVPILIIATFYGGFQLGKHRSFKKTSGIFPTGFMKLQKALVSPAFASTTPTASTSLRSNFFLIGGYPDHATWEAINPDHATEGAAPEVGLLGVMGAIIDGMASVAVANGVTSCSDVPSSGSYSATITIPLSTSVSASGTVTFETPTRSIPAAWTAGSTAFTKRVKFAATDYTVAVEFICSRSAAWASMAIPGDSISGSARVLNVYWDNTDSSASKYEMAMRVTHASACGSGGEVCDSQLLRAETGASNQFSLWSASFAWRSSKYQTDRMVMNGSSATGEFTTYYTFTSNAGTQLSDFSGTDEGATATGTYDFQQETSSDFTHKGCFNTATPTTNPTSTTDCTGYALSSPAATVFTGSGSPGFSLNGLKFLTSNIYMP